MTWLRGIAGVVLILVGLLWIGQGTNLLAGSIMSGQATWVIIGLVALAVGAWLLWTLARARGSVRTAR